MIHTFSNLELDSIDIHLNDHNLENMSESKYLGVILDSKLKYDKHIMKLTTKLCAW